MFTAPFVEVKILIFALMQRKNKHELPQKQANKIEVIEVLTKQFGGDFEGKVNYLEVVKNNIEEAGKK